MKKINIYLLAFIAITAFCFGHSLQEVGKTSEPHTITWVLPFTVLGLFYLLFALGWRAGRKHHKNENE